MLVLAIPLYIILATSCEELLAMPCCSNNETPTTSCSFVDTNLVEENEELKAQVTSLKKDLEKCCDDILSVQKNHLYKSRT